MMLLSALLVDDSERIPIPFAADGRMEVDAEQYTGAVLTDIKYESDVSVLRQ